MSTADRLGALRAAAERELREDILPYWSTRAVDREQGGFFGAVSVDGRPDPGAGKGGVLNARILWTFSAALRRRPEPLYREMADRAFDYLLEHFWDPKHSGLYWEVDHLGRMLPGSKADLRPGLRHLRAGRVLPGDRRARSPRSSRASLRGRRDACARPLERRLLGGARARLAADRRHPAIRRGPERALLDEQPPPSARGLHDAGPRLRGSATAGAAGGAARAGAGPHPRREERAPDPLLRRAVAADVGRDLVRPRHRDELADLRGGLRGVRPRPGDARSGGRGQDGGRSPGIRATTPSWAACTRTGRRTATSTPAKTGGRRPRPSWAT